MKTWRAPEGQDAFKWRRLNAHADEHAGKMLEPELGLLAVAAAKPRREAREWTLQCMKHLRHATLDFAQKMWERVDDSDARRPQRHLPLIRRARSVGLIYRVRD